MTEHPFDLKPAKPARAKRATITLKEPEGATPAPDHSGLIVHGAVTIDTRNQPPTAHVSLTKPVQDLLDDLYHALFGWYKP